ncbi:DNA polymerase I [Sulfurospirillum arcachonense]|uniref:DNA polymerase I n=1 Tax=Sulfurospirillum arcachonense TaxID=57666 RepID=UPI00046999C0|nr:DNA polymerase I [Sulfurospirillum arcachonense]
MKTLTIIDTFGFFFRNFYALPNLRNKDGFPTGLITGFANFIYTLREEHETDYILFALDAKGKNFRHEIDPNYKANRSPAPEDLKTQLPVAISWIDKMGFKAFSQEGYEADDVIAAAVRFAKKHDIKVRIVSHDKDLYQLIEDGSVVIYDPMKKQEIDREKCFEKFGVYPEHVGDYLSIVGDSADNVPGVKGIGAKGAKKLIDDFGDVANIYKNLDNVLNPRTKKLLEESHDNAFLSKELVKLDDSLDISDKFESFHFPLNQPLENIVDELEKYDLKGILSRLKYAPKVEEKKETHTFEPILLDNNEKLFSVVERLSKEDIVAFDTETTGLDVRSASIVGFSFATDTSKAYYVPIAHNYLGVGDQVSFEDAKKAIEKIFTCKVVGQNLKYDFAIVKQNFQSLHVEYFVDTMVLAWLLNPELSAGLDSLAKRFFSYEMVKFKDVVPKGQNFSVVDLEDACKYASEDAWMTLKLYEKLIEKLDPNLLTLAKNIEFPFIMTLLDMEEEGIKVDIEYFCHLELKTNSAIEELKIDIFKMCEMEFNLNSPKQLGAVLFEHMQLPVVKKTKTGYSTDESVLTKLLDEHEVISKILEYRELHKLQSTYIKPLLKLGEDSVNNRIHTSFLQTGTATGRLSSKDPNLQNIPTRTKLGREVRNGFIADEGYSFVGIDYSQIELRLLAHYSEDADLLNAFNNDLDIHRQTALKLFGEEEADKKRGVAKSINFGLLYGMGARKLAQTLGISQAEAKGYIENYFKSFATVKSYLESISDKAKEDGYVETLLGRKRYFDFENANGMQVPMYEREAVNTRFQGSAADLIKLSMNKIQNELCDENSKMLLQIHDELIFEVKDELVEYFAQKAKKIMKDIYDLKVKLDVSVCIGKNWGELK